jgi:hypothetical protein
MITIKTGQFTSLPSYNPDLPENTYTRAYADELANSRIPVKISDKLWEIKWQLKVDPFFPPDFILTAKSQFIALGAGRWHLIDSEGKLLTTEFFGNSSVIFDPAYSLVYFADRFGQIAAVKLPSNEKLFSMQVNGLEDVERKFLYRNDGIFLIADKIENKNPHNPSPNKFIYIESYAIDDPPVIENGNLASFKELNHVNYPAGNVTAAAYKDIFVYAIEDKLIITGLNLKVQSEYEGKFKPVTLSLDESGRIYLTVINNENKLALWVMTQQGELLVDTVIPVEGQLNSIPPVISFNHDIFLIFKDRVFSYREDGKLKWQTLTDGNTAGAVVTSNNKLLLSEGSMINELDETGERQPIFQFPGEVLTSPPVITSENEIIAATEGNIYLLRPKR